MDTRVTLLFLFASFASAPDLSSQMLIVDRAPSAQGHQIVGLPKGVEGFLADDFHVGVAKEVWVIDHVRVWGVPDPKAPLAHDLGDLLKNASLYGGIAPDPKAGADCDCHNLPPLETASIAPGGEATDNPDVKASSFRPPDGSQAWQIDFENLRWSVPGGTGIQFGLLTEGRPMNDARSSNTWHYLASPAAKSRHLRVFSRSGKLQSMQPEEPPARLNVQAWGHLLATISIRPAGQELQVVLRGLPFLKASQVDKTSLRFGPRMLVPHSFEVEDIDHDGKLDLVMYFQVASRGLGANSVNACLSGQRLDGAPFEGCDLLPH